MHFTDQTDQPRSTVFQKCLASCNNGVNVILQIYTGKGEEEVAGCHCDNSSFILMLVYFSFCFSLFLSWSPWLFTLFSPFRTLIWMEYQITLPVCLCFCLLNVNLLYNHLCPGTEKF